MITKDLIETLIGIKKSNNIENIGSIIIPDDSSNIPAFLKNITDIIETSPKKVTNKRNNHFSNSECICSLQFDKIKITKNINSVSLIEDKYGCYIY